MIGRLQPTVRSYAWGSRTALAGLTGRPSPAKEPEAELWMGAHESAPSGIGATTLDRLVAQDPAAVLGPAVAGQFGGRLPFLLKILAPETALSIQTHPTAEQAAAAPAGTYTDGWAKPEALIAVTDFEIFAGLRPFAEAAALLRAFEVPELTDLVDSFAGSDAPVSSLLTALLRLQGPDLQRMLGGVVAACTRDAFGAESATVRSIARIAQQYPGDRGILVLPLMVHRVLQPTEYIFVPAGVLHAYVRGVCVEILANSDNIVRAGLTPKEINIPELLRILRPEALATPERATGTRVHSFPVDVPHFQLHVVSPGSAPAALPGTGGPRIALALHAPLVVSCADGQVQLAPGESLFVDASSGDAQVCGQGTLYLATPGCAAGA